jgi:hypothetical protein
MATPAQAYRYNGKEYEEATKTYQAPFKSYDPAIGMGING